MDTEKAKMDREKTRIDLERAKTLVCRGVDDLAPLLRGVNRELYENPEPGHREYRSAGRLAGLLEEAGFEVRRATGGLETAFVAAWPEGAGGGDPVVALLAEYDALPGIGHGCGHNIIGTATVGAALAVRSLVPGGARLLVVGCPAEEGAVEGAGGKAALIEAGVFEGVDAALMVHPGPVNAMSGPTSCRLALEVSFRGRSAHAAGAPHEGLSALEAVLQTFNALNALRQHLPGRVRVHGVVVKGGEAPNVIPDEGEIRLYVRAPSVEELEPAAERVRNCARGAALATGCQVAFREFARTYLDLRPNDPLDQAFARNMTALGRPPVSRRDTGGGLGSTDMGNVSHVVPAIHPFIAIGPPGRTPPSHTREFAQATVSPEGEGALLAAAKALAMTCVDLFLAPETLEAVRRAAPGADRARPPHSGRTSKAARTPGSGRTPKTARTPGSGRTSKAGRT